MTNLTLSNYLRLSHNGAQLSTSDGWRTQGVMVEDGAMAGVSGMGVGASMR
jgi:hypothetical protein